MNALLVSLCLRGLTIALLLPVELAVRAASHSAESGVIPLDTRLRNAGSAESPFLTIDTRGAPAVGSAESPFFAINTLGAPPVDSDGSGFFVIDTRDPDPAPAIAAQPQNHTACLGANVTFEVTATGAAPLSYQWRMNGLNLSGASSAVLRLDNVQAISAADYTVIVSNASGSVTSQVARLTVHLPPAITEQPQSQTVSAGAGVSFEATAGGTAPLSYQWLKDGQSLTGATDPVLRLTNVQTTDSGSYVVEISNDCGRTNSQGAALTVNVPSGLEADLAPRPNGDQQITAADFTQLGPIVAGVIPLAELSASEFLRADCAPRSTLGDGRITAADWTQSARFVVGFDAPQSAGGPGPSSVRPLGLPTRKASAVSGRILRAGNVNASAGSVVSVPIEFAAQGNENTLAFSLEFDAKSLTYIDAAISGLPTGTTFVLNTNRVTEGRLGVLLALTAAQNLPAGTQELVRVRFHVAAGATGDLTVGFIDQPVLREVVSADVQVLATQFVSGVIHLSPALFADFQEAAGFAKDFQGPAPKGGWSYLYNLKGPISDTSNYVALLWNGTVYDNDGVPGLPGSEPGGYVYLGGGTGHPGRGSAQGPGFDVYAIASFTVPEPGFFVITNSVLEGHDSGTREVRVWVNNNPLVLNRALAGLLTRTNFDIALGELAAGDRIFVGIGPHDGRDFAADAGIDFAVGRSVAERVVRAGSVTASAGGLVNLPVELVGLGNENTLAFSLEFDPKVLSYSDAALGVLPSGTTLVLNTNRMAEGKLGVLLALPAAQNLSAGSHELLRVSFRVSAFATGSATIAFGDQPVTREVVSADVESLPTVFVGGTVFFNPGRPDPVVMPKILSGAFLTSDEFRLQIAGPPGRELAIEASTNLLNWIPLGTSTLAAGLAEFIDREATIFPRRFYRGRFLVAPGSEIIETTNQTIFAAQGGTLTLGQSGDRIAVSPNTLVRDQSVTFSLTTASPLVQEDYFDTTLVFDAGPSERLLIVNTGEVAPREGISMTVRITEDFLNLLGKTYRPQIFAKALWQDVGERLDVFEPIPTDIDRTSRQLAAAVPDWAFTALRNANGTFEALLLVGSLPNPASIKPLSLLRRSMSSEAAGLTGGVKLAGGLQPCAVGFYFPLSGLMPAALDDKVSSAWGPRKLNGNTFHDGIDISPIRGATSERVVPAADGYIAKIGWSKTYGQCVIVQHVDATGKKLGQTLYAHLQTGKIQAADAAGITDYPKAFKSNGESNWKSYRIPVVGGVTAIGVMGDTGPSGTDRHLHFEYAPAEIVFGDHTSRKDPAPCIFLNSPLRPSISLSTSELSFSATMGATTAVSKSFSVANVGDEGSSLNYSISISGDLAGRIILAPAKGSLLSGLSIVHSLSVSSAGLKPGTYSATLMVDDLYAVNRSQTISIALIVTALPPPSVPAISIADASATEGNAGSASVIFQVTLSTPSTVNVTVDYATADGSATAGSDYVAAKGTITINAGTTNAVLTVLVLSDTIVELDEAFSVNLSQPVNATIAKAQGVATIINDDLPPFVITTTSLPSASNQGLPKAYLARVLATGGVPPCVWTATGLPAGFNLQPLQSGGKVVADEVDISGFPGNGQPEARDYPVTIKGVDSRGRVAEKTLTLSITGAPASEPESWAGTWTGQHQYSGQGSLCFLSGGGKLVMAITVNGAGFTGTATFAGIQVREISPPTCNVLGYLTASGTVSGTIAGDAISGTFNGTTPFVDFGNDTIAEGPWPVSFQGVKSGSIVSGTVAETSRKFPGTFTLSR